MRERRKDAEAIAIVGKCLIFCAVNFTMITLLSLLIIPPDKVQLRFHKQKTAVHWVETLTDGREAKTDVQIC